MRVFLVIDSSGNSSVSENKVWHRNLHDPLIDLGHEVFLLPTREGRLAMARKSKRLRQKFSDKLVDSFQREHKKKPFSLIFTYLKEGMVDPEAVNNIRSSGVPVVNFSCNNIHQFYLVKSLSPYFDLNLYAEKNAADKFKRISSEALWWPMASNPTYFKPESIKSNVDISFVGANYGTRASYVKQLLLKGFDVHSYGPNWRININPLNPKRIKRILKCILGFNPDICAKNTRDLSDYEITRKLNLNFPKNFHPPVSDEKLIRLYSESKISLGFLEVYDKHDASGTVLQHMHLRDFEAPMCGACYLTGFSEEVAECFEPDKEIITYRNRFEMEDKVKFYLSHPEQAEKIRSAGLSRALKDHTYQTRFKTLFDKLGLK